MVQLFISSKILKFVEKNVSVFFYLFKLENDENVGAMMKFAIPHDLRATILTYSLCLLFLFAASSKQKELIYCMAL